MTWLRRLLRRFLTWLLKLVEEPVRRPTTMTVRFDEPTEEKRP